MHLLLFRLALEQRDQPWMRPHAGYDAERPTDQERGDLAPARMRSEFEQDHLHCANSEAGESRRDVMPIVDVQ